MNKLIVCGDCYEEAVDPYVLCEPCRAREHDVEERVRRNADRMRAVVEAAKDVASNFRGGDGVAAWAGCAGALVEAVDALNQGSSGGKS